MAEAKEFIEVEVRTPPGASRWLYMVEKWSASAEVWEPETPPIELPPAPTVVKLRLEVTQSVKVWQADEVA